MSQASLASQGSYPLGIASHPDADHTPKFLATTLLNEPISLGIIPTPGAILQDLERLNNVEWHPEDSDPPPPQSWTMFEIVLDVQLLCNEHEEDPNQH